MAYNVIKSYHDVLQFFTTIEFTNIDIVLWKKLNEVSPSDDCFPYEYIDAEVNKNLDDTKGWVAGTQMEKEAKHYV